MPPKKKAKAKKSTKDESANDPSLADQTPPLEFPADAPNFVTLDMRLLNWNYLNFKIRTKTTTRLFGIKQQLHKRHGPIASLQICKNHFAEANEMRDDMATLADYGIDGAPENEPEVICVLHYDFKPEQHDNPLLLASEDK